MDIKALVMTTRQSYYILHHLTDKWALVYFKSASSFKSNFLLMMIAKGIRIYVEGYVV